MTSTETAKNKIVVLDYSGRQINYNYYLSNNLKTEQIYLHKFNFSYEDICKTLKDRCIIKNINGKYIMNEKDAINLDKMIGLAYIAMNESEKNNKWLRTRNEVLENKCKDFDHIINEYNMFKCILDDLILNLCLALGRKVDDNENVMHLINVCAALKIQENENHYILMENKKSKDALEKRLVNIRVNTLNNYDEILSNIDSLKEQLIIKDQKISNLTDELYLVKAENINNNNTVKFLEEKFIQFSCESNWEDEKFNISFNKPQNDNELHESKLLILEQINQFDKYNIDADNYQLPDLINILMKIIFDKQEQLEAMNSRSILSLEDKNHQLIKEIDYHKGWQIHLENENEKLNSEVEEYKRVQNDLLSKENELYNLKNDFLKMKNTSDELYESNFNLKMLINDYKNQLSEKLIKYYDNNNIIKTLQSNVTDKTNKLEQLNLMYNNEKEKCKQIESETLKIVKKLNDEIHKKNNDIFTIKDDNFNLNDKLNWTIAENQNLKQNMFALECVFNEKNETLRNMEEKGKKQQNIISSLQLNNLLQNFKKLEQQTSSILDKLHIYHKEIFYYGTVLDDIEYFIEKQSKLKNVCTFKYENIKKKYKKLKGSINTEKEILLLEHSKQIENLKKEYNLKITSLYGMYTFHIPYMLWHI